MELILLNLSTSTDDEIIQAIECNARISRLLSSEVDKLRKVAASVKTAKKVVVVEEESKETPPSPPYVDEDFEDEIDYYLQQLNRLRLEDLDNKILTVLPSRKHYQYERILRRLRLEAMRSIKEIKDVVADEGLSLDDVEDFKEELALETKKIALIDKALAPQTAIEHPEELPANKLIFVPTSGGNIRALDEIDSIPTEYYDRFLGLFESIKDGTFKNVRRFSSNSELQGLSEVKDFKVRVVYVRLSDDCYAIISAFVKKSDKDKGYRTSLERKYSEFQHQEAALIANLANPEFMELQSQYEQMLFDKLVQGTYDKPITTISRQKTKSSKKGGE